MQFMYAVHDGVAAHAVCAPSVHTWDREMQLTQSAVAGCFWQ
jgi:hypothetical protein